MEEHFLAFRSEPVSPSCEFHRCRDIAPVPRAATRKEKWYGRFLLLRKSRQLLLFLSACAGIQVEKNSQCGLRIRIDRQHVFECATLTFLIARGIQDLGKVQPRLWLVR